MDPTIEQESPAEDAGEASAGKAYSVELYVSADGSMSINVESGEEEAEQHGGEMPTGTPVKGLKEAVEMILEIVQNGGQMESDTDEMAGFQEAFKKPGAAGRFA